jgi:branched-chain amino acid transport system ATP-binding protein
VSLSIAVSDLVAGYGPTVVLEGVTFNVPAGGTLAVLGRNGVGKTTLLATLMGLTTWRAGGIRLGEMDISAVPTHRRSRLGLAYVPQEREIFPSLTVEENIAVSLHEDGWSAEAVFDLFPRLAERRATTGNRLSGGEQQMLAIGRALAGAPKALLLDEPLEGLAPIVVDALMDALGRVRDQSGVTMILVEQKAALALGFADDVIVLDRGRIVHRGKSEELAGNEALQAELLGVAQDEASA